MMVCMHECIKHSNRSLELFGFSVIIFLTRSLAPYYHLKGHGHTALHEDIKELVFFCF